MKILVVDDEALLVKGIRFNLQNEGYEVITGSDGLEAVQAVQTQHPDLVVLDVMMPNMDGLSACAKIREFSDVPIIMLTAKGDDMDKLIGFDHGADDYLTKPFVPRELVARIRAVLRRGQDNELLPELVEAGGVRMDVERHEVTVNGESIRLALKEFELLELLLRNSGRVMTRGQLIDRIWGADYVGDTKTLDVHVKRLRAKIERDPSSPVLLVTVRGLGYKFEG